MRVRVRFRFNTESGEVELFQIDDLGAGERAAGSALTGAEHDAEHDRISAEIGAVTARRPDVEEIQPLPLLMSPPADPSLWSAPRRVDAEEADADTDAGELGTQ